MLPGHSRPPRFVLQPHNKSTRETASKGIETVALGASVSSRPMTPPSCVPTAAAAPDAQSPPRRAQQGLESRDSPGCPEGPPTWISPQIHRWTSGQVARVRTAEAGGLQTPTRSPSTPQGRGTWGLSSPMLRSRTRAPGSEPLGRPVRQGAGLKRALALSGKRARGMLGASRRPFLSASVFSGRDAGGLWAQTPARAVGSVAASSLRLSLPLTLLSISSAASPFQCRLGCQRDSR